MMCNSIEVCFAMFKKEKASDLAASPAFSLQLLRAGLLALSCLQTLACRMPFLTNRDML